ncbi:Tat pathway signal protein [Berryella wangjianweii]|uniref:Tat pathway signal protein n=1 Tax=Berryella wangjianweii TaxID=2734634 RepID=A0A6M8J457_9ACTN|nr:Tat pathway signal protein [Berryella wangjianweii]QKF07393.1 Tat pathway signal protein [Berryella wangjianweii]
MTGSAKPSAGRSAAGVGSRGHSGIGSHGRSSVGSHAGVAAHARLASASAAGGRLRRTATGRVPLKAQQQSTLVTRRRFVLGAIGAGAVVAAAGAGTFALAHRSRNTVALDTLKVPKSAVTTLDDLTALDGPDGMLSLSGTIELPLGTLVWMSHADVAACLVPGAEGSPLATVSLLSLAGAPVATPVLSRAQGAAEGFEIYDVRATDKGLVWVEANILSGAWRVHTAPLNGTKLGAVALADEGEADTEAPSLAAIDGSAFWLVNPKPHDDVVSGSCVLRGAAFGSDSPRELMSAPKRAYCPLQAGPDALVVAARSAQNAAHVQISCINPADGTVRDSIALPAGMRPLEVAYGPTGLAFSFEKIYSFGEGIANLGTYVPRTRAGGSAGAYDDAPWFRFGRTPSSAPCWCGKLLTVKSTYSVAVVDLAAGTYFSIPVDSGASSYGECTATVGAFDRLVTFANIDYTPVGKSRVRTCRVKVWQPA